MRAVREPQRQGLRSPREDEERYPLARWLREHLVDETLDFTALSRQLAERVQAIADEEERRGRRPPALAHPRGRWRQPVGGLCSAAPRASRSAVVSSRSTAPMWTSPRCTPPGGVDLAGWRRGDERYLGHLRGRGKGGAWFWARAGLQRRDGGAAGDQEAGRHPRPLVDTERPAPRHPRRRARTRPRLPRHPRRGWRAGGVRGARARGLPRTARAPGRAAQGRGRRRSPRLRAQPARHPPAGTLQRQRGELEAGVRAQRPAFRRRCTTTAPPTPWCCRACRITGRMLEEDAKGWRSTRRGCRRTAAERLRVDRRRAPSTCPQPGDVFARSEARTPGRYGFSQERESSHAFRPRVVGRGFSRKTRR